MLEAFVGSCTGGQAVCRSRGLKFRALRCSKNNFGFRAFQIKSSHNFEFGGVL